MDRRGAGPERQPALLLAVLRPPAVERRARGWREDYERVVLCGRASGPGRFVAAGPGGRVRCQELVDHDGDRVLRAALLSDGEAADRIAIRELVEAYLGLLWATIYLAIDAFSPGSIRMGGDPADRQTELLYVSLITLSTVGYATSCR